MNLIDFLYGPIANALGWTLLHALWQGFALVLPTAVVLHLLRHRSSTLRYQVGVVSLLVQLLVSAATFLWYYEPAMTAVQATTYPASLNTFPIRWQSVTHTLPWHQQVQHFLQVHLSQFVLVYLIGVGLFGLRLAGGWLYLQRLSQTATQPATLTFTELTSTLRSAMAIRAVVRVRESARIAVPMVVGVLKPVLLLPIGLAANLSIRDVEAVLAHELAHIKRHDYAVNLLQSFMEVLYFFHPALWWLSARVREEREHCCDDLAVLAIGGDGRILAQALARVEELRLTQTGTSPTLAMAFAAKRQHLLHRVRRMLGVPTRPFVSNSSLAGLTLATVLLVSVSVYAVQKQDAPKPKPRQAQPHPTRRHKVGKGTEFGISDNKKISYVVWKGQKLPASHVARLQRQLDQVMAGQLNLDTVKQPDRDMLLTVIETNNSFGEGMKGLAEGLSHIDYNSIVQSSLDAANVAATTSVDVRNALKDAEEALREVEKVDYNQVIGDAMAGVAEVQADLDSTIQPEIVSVLRRQDSLLELNEINRGKVALLQAQAQSQGFTVEAVERKIERIERQRSMLEQKRFSETSAQQLAIMRSGLAKTDSARATSMKQIEAGEQTIQNTESDIEKLNQQLITMQTELEKVRKPLRETQAQIRKLNYSGQLSYLGYAGASPNVIHPRPPYPPKAPFRRLHGVASPMPPMTPFAPARPNVMVTPPTTPRPAVKPKTAPTPKPD